MLMHYYACALAFSLVYNIVYVAGWCATGRERRPRAHTHHRCYVLSVHLSFWHLYCTVLFCGIHRSSAWECTMYVHCIGNGKQEFVDVRHSHAHASFRVVTLSHKTCANCAFRVCVWCIYACTDWPECIINQCPTIDRHRNGMVHGMQLIVDMEWVTNVYKTKWAKQDRNKITQN